MAPARRLRVLDALTLAWAAAVLPCSPGIAWTQTTEPAPPPVGVAPPTTGPAPAQPSPAGPEKGGKSPCDNGFVKPFCATGEVAKKLAEGDLSGAAGAAVSTVVAPVRS